MHYRDGDTDAQCNRAEKPGRGRDSGGAGMPEPACEGIPPDRARGRHQAETARRKYQEPNATSESPIDKQQGSIQCPRPYLGWTGLRPLWPWFIDTTHVRAGKWLTLARKVLKVGGCFVVWPVNSLTSMVGPFGQIGDISGNNSPYYVLRTVVL